MRHGRPLLRGSFLGIAASETLWHEQNGMIAFKRAIVNVNIIVTGVTLLTVSFPDAVQMLSN